MPPTCVTHGTPFPVQPNRQRRSRRQHPRQTSRFFRADLFPPHSLLRQRPARSQPVRRAGWTQRCLGFRLRLSSFLDLGHRGHRRRRPQRSRRSSRRHQSPRSGLARLRRPLDARSKPRSNPIPQPTGKTLPASTNLASIVTTMLIRSTLTYQA